MLVLHIKSTFTKRVIDAIQYIACFGLNKRVKTINFVLIKQTYMLQVLQLYDDISKWIDILFEKFSKGFTQ